MLLPGNFSKKKSFIDNNNIFRDRYRKYLKMPSVSKGHEKNNIYEDNSTTEINEQNDIIEEKINPKFSSILKRFHKSHEKAQKRQKLEESINQAQKLETEIKNDTDILKDEPEPIEAIGLQPLPQPEIIRTSTVQKSFTDSLSWFSETFYISQDTTETLKFSELGLSELVTRNISSNFGFEKAFPVQSFVITKLLTDIQNSKLNPDKKKDLLVNASTGSGKTLSYSIPIIEDLKNRIVPRIRAIIIVPTKPLLNQVRKTIDLLSKGTNLKTIVLKSERTLREESRLLLNNSQPDIIISTPGRLVDHLKSSSFNNKSILNLKHLKYLVIDEADRLLNQSFQNWAEVITSIIEENEKSNNHNSTIATNWINHTQKLIFSATLTKDPGSLSSLKLHVPRIVIIGQQNNSNINENANNNQIKEFQVPDTLSEYLLSLSRNDKFNKPMLLMKLLIKFSLTSRTLIFTSSNDSAALLARLLQLILSNTSSFTHLNKKISIACCSSQLTDQQRRRVLRDLADDKHNIVIATDLIARGLDIEGIENVINYDIPLSMRDYIHRVGRTARAGNTGKAWSIICGRGESERFEKLVIKGIGRFDKKIENVKVDVLNDEEIESYNKTLKLFHQEVK